MKNKTQIIPITRAIIFLIIFLFLLRSVSLVLLPKTVNSNDMPVYSYINKFYDEPKNSLDVIYTGSSAFLRGISPMEIYKECGIVGYSRSNTVLSPMVHYMYIKNALRYQTPKVLVLDLASAYYDYDYIEQEARIHHGIDSFPMGIDKIIAAVDISIKNKSYEPYEFLIPLLRYHGRWVNIGINDFIPEKKLALSYPYVQKGSAIRFVYKTINNVPAYPIEPGATEERAPFIEENMHYYDKIIDMCKKKGIRVLVVRTPKVAWSTEQYNAVLAYTQEKGVDYLDFNTPEIKKASGYLPQEDFYDSNHLNAVGAKKISVYLAHYLEDNYGLSDRRTDPAYAEWNANIKDYDDFYQKGMDEFKKID